MQLFTFQKKIINLLFSNVIQWRLNDSLLPPTFTYIMQSYGVTVMFPYNHDYRHQYNILYDKVHWLDVYHQNLFGKFNSYRKKFGKTIQFSSAYGTGKFF